MDETDPDSIVTRLPFHMDPQEGDEPDFPPHVELEPAPLQAPPSEIGEPPEPSDGDEPSHSLLIGMVVLGTVFGSLLGAGVMALL